jgi:predicted glycogen debranching enzyme
MREWLVTNGLGSYASLTYSNDNTRKFHGLLIASLNPPTRRWIFISNVYEKIKIDDLFYNLRDYKSRFFFNYFPDFLYEINDVKIIKTIFMNYQKNTTIIKYEIKTNKPITITHSPILNSRHIYDTNTSESVTFEKKIIDQGIQIKPNNIEKNIKIILNGSEYKSADSWIELFYEKDRIRNDSWVDNGLFIGNFSKKINQSTEYYLVLTIENTNNINPSKIFRKEIERKERLIAKARIPQKFNKMVLSADNFIVKRKDRKSIIAGYHWFADWGRDTLISIPGLTLITKRYSDAKDILFCLSNQCKNGLIPNAYMDSDSKSVYNTVDASLWYVDRVYQYVKYTNDLDFVIKIWETLQSIIDCYINGTDFDIQMDNDFLIKHSEGLTWMDVRIGNFYPTPRSKKAVEIQALWYNALKIMEQLAFLINKDDLYLGLAQKVKESFNAQFDRQYDVLDTKDVSIRPNQIFLASLDFSMIKKSLIDKILCDVQNNLVTIFGLRTLSPYDSKYKGNYLGDYHRDIAYHNGTVWPWLLGSFIKAFVKNKNYDSRWREFAFQNFLRPMLDVFGDNWDGSIYEIFDGDPPFLPRGCISQAWSVAEIFRSWIEDIQNIRPKYEKIFLHEISI